jgi:8-hydroxy-5-deazaflavin:NADPH oxidoreductase
MPSIGIIGAGNIGRAFAKALAKNGIGATLSNSRGPDSLREVAAAIGPAIKPGTREEAATKDIVLVAVNWPRVAAALAGLPDFGGRIVIDANNPTEPPLFKPANLQGRTSSAIVADLVPGARVVKAFNHLFAALLECDPRAEGGRRVLFYSGDDNLAKTEVAALIDQLGFLRHRSRPALRRSRTLAISWRPAPGSQSREVRLRWLRVMPVKSWRKP